MRLYLTRHTRTNYNDLRLCNSNQSVDVHLTEVGVAQARDLALRLKGVWFEKIIISELPRTRQTADIINQYHQLPIEVDSRINDNATGFEDKSVDLYIESLEAAADKWNFRGEKGGESLSDVRNRASEFLSHLKRQSLQSVLIVSHQCTLQMMIGIIQHLADEDILGVEVLHGEYYTFDI